MIQKADYKIINNQFKINGLHYDRLDLFELANNFIKNGKVYQKEAGIFILDWLDNNSVIKTQTSGSTGIPKIITIEKNAMVNSALATASFFNLKSTDIALHCLPTQFIAGKMMFVRAFILGLDLHFVEPTSSPLENNTTIFDFGAMVPFQVENSISHLKNVKKLIIGGTKINPKLEKSLQNISSEIYETYGMTETVTHIAAKKLGEKTFTILPNVKISVDDRNCLNIDAPLISIKKIITNDIVELVNEKQFIFVGRFDNVINSGGIKLFPEKIESKLADKINSRFIVVGKPDETLGEKLVLVIESEKYEIENSIFEVLEKYEKPKEIIFVKKFKETLTSKIIRKDFFN